MNPVVAVFMVLALLAVSGKLAYDQLTGVTMSNVVLTTEMQTVNNVESAARALTAEADDLDADGVLEPVPPRAPVAGEPAAPLGGGLVPTTSAGPKTDGYGTPLGYCGWDNGLTNTGGGLVLSGTNNPPDINPAPFIAIIYAGEDRTFQTTCAMAATGTAAVGERVRLVSVSDGVTLASIWRPSAVELAAITPGVMTTIRIGHIPNAATNVSTEVEFDARIRRFLYADYAAGIGRFGQSRVVIEGEASDAAGMYSIAGGVANSSTIYISGGGGPSNPAVGNANISLGPAGTANHLVNIRGDGEVQVGAISSPAATFSKGDNNKGYLSLGGTLKNVQLDGNANGGTILVGPSASPVIFMRGDYGQISTVGAGPYMGTSAWTNAAPYHSGNGKEINDWGLHVANSASVEKMLYVKGDAGRNNLAIETEGLVRITAANPVTGNGLGVYNSDGWFDRNLTTVGTMTANSKLVVNGFGTNMDPTANNWAAEVNGVLVAHGHIGTYATFHADGDMSSFGKLIVTGNITSGASVYANAYYYSSDESLKEDIKDLPPDEAMEAVRRLEGKTFRWKKDGRRDIGFVAQQMETVLPDLVGTNPDQTKAVEYGNVTAVLAQALKNIDRRLEEAKAATREAEALATAAAGKAAEASEAASDASARALRAETAAQEASSRAAQGAESSMSVSARITTLEDALSTMETRVERAEALAAAAAVVALLSSLGCAALFATIMRRRAGHPNSRRSDHV